MLRFKESEKESIRIFPMNVKLAIRMLNWPILWRWAANWLSWCEHDATAAACPPCAAQARRLQEKHLPVCSFNRLMVCSKCGLSSTYWQRWPRCAGKPLLRHKVMRNPVVRSIMAWD